MNPCRKCGILEDVLEGEVMVSPRQEEGRIFRALMEQRPHFDGTWHPLSPELREPNGHFVPMPADLAKPERSGVETCVVILYTKLDNAEEHFRQELCW